MLSSEWLDCNSLWRNASQMKPLTFSQHALSLLLFRKEKNLFSLWIRVIFASVVRWQCYNLMKCFETCPYDKWVPYKAFTAVVPVIVLPVRFTFSATVTPGRFNLKQWIYVEKYLMSTGKYSLESVMLLLYQRWIIIRFFNRMTI